MPTYVYACKACAHQFEKFQSFSAKALRTCPNCGEKALSKVIFPAGVVFKGSGFYVNDSKVSSSTNPTGAKESSSDDTVDSSRSTDSAAKKPGPKDATKVSAKKDATSKKKPSKTNS